MSARCAETIQGQILARVFKIKGGSEPLLVFSDTGSSAGLEIMGKKEDF